MAFIWGYGNIILGYSETWPRARVAWLVRAQACAVDLRDCVFNFMATFELIPFTSLFAEIVTSFATTGRKQESPFRSQLTSNSNNRTAVLDRSILR